MGQQNVPSGKFEIKADIANNDMGPALLGVFAFYLLAQGFIYIVRPDLSSRALTASKEKMRRNGFILLLIGGFLMYSAFSWWMGSWTGGIAQGVR